MNELTFKIDKYEQIVSCHYVEDIFNVNNKEENVKNVDLPYKALKKVYEVCLKKFNKFQNHSNLPDSCMQINFYDVDIRFIEEILKLSEKYKAKIHTSTNQDEEIKEIYALLASKTKIEESKEDNINVEINKSDKPAQKQKETKDKSYSNKKSENKKKKLNRKNLFKKAVIIAVGTGLLATLIAYSLKENGYSLFPNETYISETTSDEETPIPIVSLRNSDNTTSDNYISVCENYYEVIKKWANIYGISPELVAAMASYNGGIHKSGYNSDTSVGLLKIDGKTIGKTIKSFNFYTQQYEEVLVVSNTYLKMYGDKVDYSKTLCNIDYADDNIQVGCMILQNELYNEKIRNNIIMGIISHEIDFSKISEVLIHCERMNKCSYDSYFEQGNTEWLKYRAKKWEHCNINYLEDVLSYVPNNTNIYFTRPDGTVYSFIYNNLNEKVVYQTK